MPTRFAEIAFTDSVKAAQSRYGSRAANRGFETSNDPRNVLTLREQEFIEQRDGFYQATVGESGWPYVQFRGGPAGFLKVLDERTIGYADFRGNVQYISVGNLNADDRIALILMDYPNQRRLKIWARARVIDEADAPELIARLEVPSYRARVERAITLTIEAYDWNCPQHITPRFSEDEVRELLLEPLQARIAQLERDNRALQAAAYASATVDMAAGETSGALGDGPLELMVTAISQLTPKIRSFGLRAPDGGELPAWTAGAHITVPVRLRDGSLQTRRYSLAGDPARRDRYEIAVQREDGGQGGSVAVHRLFALGQRLRCGLPENRFRLHQDDRPALLVAGGIGITPLRAMAYELDRQGRPFHLHFIARTPATMPYRAELAEQFGDRVHFWYSREAMPLDVAHLLRTAPPQSLFYVCGPERLIEEVRAAASAIELADGRVRFERFSAPALHADDRPIQVELRRSGKTLVVSADQSILDAAIEAGVDPLYDCKLGTCGTCAVKVLEGDPDHRDTALSTAERQRAGLMCTCVSRAKGERLVLDL